MDGLLRRRGGVSAQLAKAYFDYKRAQIATSIRNTFSKRRTSDGIDGDSDDDIDIEAQRFLASNDSHSATDIPYLAEWTAEYRNLPFLTRVVLVVAGWAFLMNVLVLSSFHVWITCFAGILSSSIAAVVFIRQLKLENMEELREVHNGIRRDVNQFAKENLELTNSVSKLNYQVSSLQQQESALKNCAQEQSTNVETLRRLVRENRKLTNERKQVVRRDLIATLMRLVIEGESDDSGDFSEREIRRMILYMRGLPAVEINEELLRKAIETNNSSLSILHLVQDIGREGVQEGDNIFIIEDRSDELLARLRQAP